MLVKILAVFLCGTPVVWLMSLLYCSASGTDLPHGLFKVYGVLYRAPGVPTQRNDAAGCTSSVMAM